MRRFQSTPASNAVQKNKRLIKLKPGAVRIIGGEWRSRRIRFDAGPGLRPTPDRVRETLFNWLAPVIRGSRCLDLYAGSGALGLEALSRGAQQVCFVESDAHSARQLQAAVKMLAPERAEVIQGDASRWLAGPARPFDVVFLDPPFDSKLLPGVMAQLESAGWLAPRAWIYLEHPAGGEVPVLPAGWVMHRSSKAGAVGYHLALRSAVTGEGLT